MHILYITPYTPNHIRVRPFEILRTLAGRGHQITLGTLWSNAEEKAELDQLADLGIRPVGRPMHRRQTLQNTLMALPSADPLQAHYAWHPALAQDLDQVLQTQPVDVIHVEHLRGARYALHVAKTLQAMGKATPVVWDSVDCISHLFRQAAQQSANLTSRLITRFELPRTEAYERFLVGQFSHILVTSSIDKTALQELFDDHGHTLALSDKIHVLPNGVDLDYFQPPKQDRLENVLVLSGKMSYHANVTAARQLVYDIMPRVWQERPDIDVWIVGKEPGSAVRSLTEHRSPGSGRVVVTGTVPDIRPYLLRATLAVAPIPYGAGIQNKVLEAMACATPVIASSQAISALQLHDGQELAVAHDPAGFAQKILALLAAPEERRRLGQAGRAYVEYAHAWVTCVAQLEQIYQQGHRDCRVNKETLY